MVNILQWLAMNYTVSAPVNNEALFKRLFSPIVYYLHRLLVPRINKTNGKINVVSMSTFRPALTDPQQCAEGDQEEGEPDMHV